eukprot:93067_1
MATEILFGSFAETKCTFSDLLQNEQNWCWDFILNYSKDQEFYLNETVDKNTNKKIKKNCKAFYEYLSDVSLSTKKPLKSYTKNCKKLNILDNIPSLIFEKIFWIFASNPSGKFGGMSGGAGKWMLFFNKHFLTYSYNELQTELIQIFELNINNENDNGDEKEEKKEDKKEIKYKQIKKDIMLTEL